MSRLLKKTRKAGAAKLQAASKTARMKVREYNKFIKLASSMQKESLKYQSKIDELEASKDEKSQKLRYVCEKKIQEAEKKVEEKIKKLEEKIRLASQKEEQALEKAEEQRPGASTEELAQNPQFEKIVRPRKKPVPIQESEISYVDVVKGQTAGKKRKYARRTRKLK